MVEVSDLQVGMRVKVVDKWPPGDICYQVDPMNKFLGSIVTVRRDSDYGVTYVIIEEDGGEWAWNKYCFDYIVEDENEIEQPDMGCISDMLGVD